MKKFFIAILPMVVIITTGLIVYWPSRSYEFVYLDEELYILNRQEYLSDVSNIGSAFIHGAAYPVAESNFYRPLLTVSFMIDAARGGIQPRAYHTTNIILHIGAILVAWLLIRELGFHRRFALLGALVFLAHPLLTQAVAWIPGRNDSLLAIFAFASVYFFLRRWTVAHLLAFALALFTKESAIVIPLLCGILHWALRPQPRRRFLTLGIEWAGVLLVWFVLRHVVLSASQPSAFDPALFMRTALPAILMYLGKTLIPVRLAVLPFLHNTSLWWGIGAVALLIVGLWKGVARHERRLALVGIAWMFLWLIPGFISVETPTRTVFLEHRAYLPLFGFLVVAFLIFRRFLQPKLATAVLTVVIVVLAAATRVREPIFANAESFWQSAVMSAPDLSRAHDGLAIVRSRGGDYPGALPEHLRAIELAPNDRRLHNNLGATYVRMGLFADAERAFLQEIEINPRFSGAYKNLAALYTAQHRDREAAEMLAKVQSL